ncbi:MAG: hypothetical protein AAGH57_11560 [Pseudomonadota bacterium]
MACGVARNLRRAFRAYRRWTDRMLLHGFDRRTPVIAAMLPTVIMVLFSSLVGINLKACWVFPLLSLVWAVWQGWTLTRVRHAFHVANWVSGKRYEREERFQLPPEYRSSENAYLAARRRRLENGKK